ncbi:hypothetical protein [Bacillus cereus]|nr:hypothetical protein [Bacillus cereus]MDR4982991.1 hypothetical protein [Bacillus cereus]
MTDWKVVVGEEAAYGSISAEATFGLMNELNVSLELKKVKYLYFLLGG